LPRDTRDFAINPAPLMKSTISTSQPANGCIRHKRSVDRRAIHLLAQIDETGIREKVPLNIFSAVGTVNSG
jgi:hypothetical protein